MSSDHSLTLLYLSLPNRQKIELQISLCNSSKSSTIWNYWKSGFPRNPDFLRPWIPRYKMGIEKRNYRHNSTESPLLHAYNIDNFKWAVCLAWPLNKQTNKTNKWDTTTAIPVANTNSLDYQSIAIKFAIKNQCQKQIETQKIWSFRIDSDRD